MGDYYKVVRNGSVTYFMEKTPCEMMQDDDPVHDPSNCDCTPYPPPKPEVRRPLKIRIRWWVLERRQQLGLKVGSWIYGQDLEEMINDRW